MNAFDEVPPTSGDYTISVYLYRTVAYHSETAPFANMVGIEPSGAALDQPVSGDFADGLQVRPDFWQVWVASTLGWRAGPSAAEVVKDQIPNGQLPRYLGCRINEGRRWCHVSTSRSGH